MHVIIYIKQNISIVYNFEDVRGIFSSIIQLCFFHLNITYFIFQSYGVNAADLKKLKAVGICTVKGLKMVTKKKLSAIKGLSDAKVDKIREALLKSCGDGTVFCTALEVAVKRKNCFHIATGKL